MAVSRGVTFEGMVRSDMGRAYESTSLEQLVDWVVTLLPSSSAHHPESIQKALHWVEAEFEYITGNVLRRAPTELEREELRRVSKDRPLPITRGHFTVLAIYRAAQSKSVVTDIDAVFGGRSPGNKDY